MLSHVGDAVAGVTWPRRDIDAESFMLAMVLPSHARDGIAGATWPRCNIDVESCWRWCCRVMLVTVLSG
jgi:hypothetical protein